MVEGSLRSRLEGWFRKNLNFRPPNKPKQTPEQRLFLKRAYYESLALRLTAYQRFERLDRKSIIVDLKEGIMEDKYATGNGTYGLKASE